MAKNASLLFGSQLVTWALTFVLMLVQPRYLGPSGFGELRFAFSVWAIMGVVVAFGMETLIIKEVARDRSRVASLLGTSLLMRTALFLVSCAVVGGYLWLIGASAETSILVYLVGLSSVIGFLGASAEASLRGLEQMKGVSLAGIANKLTNTVLGIGLLVVGLGVFAVGVAAAVAAAVGAAVALWFVMRRAGVRPSVEPRLGSSMLRESMPYLLTSGAMALYGQIDTLVIHQLVDSTVLGWYTVSVMLTGTLLFIPVILATVIFPSMARSHAGGAAGGAPIIRKGFDLMLLIALPLGLGLGVVSTPLVTMIFGADFAPAGPVLAVMGIVLILFFMNILLAQYLISIDRQNLWTVLTLCAVVATVLLDIALVPWFQQRYGNGALGGAVSYVITEAAMFVVAVLSVPRGTLLRANAWSALRTLAAGGLMTGACWLARDMALGVTIAIGALSYLAAVAALRIVPAEDVRFLVEMVRWAVRRIRSRAGKPLGTEGAV